MDDELHDYGPKQPQFGPPVAVLTPLDDAASSSSFSANLSLSDQEEADCPPPSTLQPFKCHFCPKSYKTEKGKLSHVTNYHEKKHTCPECNRHFASKQGRDQHVNGTVCSTKPAAKPAPSPPSPEPLSFVSPHLAFAPRLAVCLQRLTGRIPDEDALVADLLAECEAQMGCSITQGSIGERVVAH